MTDFAIFIPARYESTRYPGKPLARLTGSTGLSKSLIRRCWEAATAVAPLDRVWVLTDDNRIGDAAKEFGAQVAITPKSCANGTERCAAALDVLGDVAPIIVNLQGDAPLTPSFVVHDLVDQLDRNPDAAMTTPAVRCSPSLYDHLITDQNAGRVGGTTVVFDRLNRALYFSKRVLPYIAPNASHAADRVHLHLGVYAYRPEALRAYAAAKPSAAEQSEGLEQLRFLDIGQQILAVPFPPLEWDCVELNNPSDIDAIEAVLASRGIV